MDLRRVKWWQWAFAGMIAGLCMGSAQLLRGNDAMVGGEGFISQRVFEQVVKQPVSAGASQIVSLNIRPTPQVDMVTLNLSDRFMLGASQVRFAAPRPYKPRGEALPSSSYTVRDFLKPLADGNPALRPRYAWWGESRWRLAFWMAGGAAVVGGIWPGVIILLLGKLPPEAPAVKLTAPPPQPEKAV